MQNQEIVAEKEGFVLRFARAEDAVPYYEQNYCPLDREVARLTGSQEVFPRETVISFFLQSVQEEDRAYFLIIAPDGSIIGEAVISDVDWELRRGSFRIALFRDTYRNRGIGTWAIEATRDFAFGQWNLHRLELEVFSFNPRAEQAYRRAGFRREGVLRDGVMDGNQYADVILMSILEPEWRAIREA